MVTIVTGIAKVIVIPIIAPTGNFLSLNTRGVKSTIQKKELQSTNQIIIGDQKTPL